MDIRELQRSWDTLGKADALWAILTKDDKAGGLWDLHEFFQTGEVEIADVLDYLRSLGVSIERQRALDFGCGVGRLTQALCSHFDQCDGVDIAPSMIDLAKQYNKYPDRCRYHLNESDDLTLFADDSFDFVYSNIVLQHMPPEYSEKYVKEFLRILKVGGVTVFQLPSEQQDNPVPDESEAASGYVLPDHAFAARLAVKDMPSVVRPVLPVNLQVVVANMSTVSWPASQLQGTGQSLNLGNHWLDPSGALLINDDGRAPLTQDLGPGEETEVPLIVHPPAIAGAYVIEIDLVQENVAWFSQKKSSALRLRIDVVPEDAQRAPESESTAVTEDVSTGSSDDTAPAFAAMQMHGVPRDVVTNWITDAGGTTIDIRADDFATGWNGFRYCVAKTSEPSPTPPLG